MQFDFILAMKDETLGRRVHWIEDHKGCQDTAVRESFLHMGNEVAKEFHSCVLLEHKKLQSAHFPDIFGISCSCMNCFFPKEPFTTPFSVFLFLFEVNLAKSIFQTLKYETDLCAKWKCVWTSKTSHLIGSQNNTIQQHSTDHMSQTLSIRVSHGYPS